MARLRLFAAIREAAGTTVAEVPGATVGEVIHAAIERFGPTFADQVPVCRVWVNGEPADDAHAVVDSDEVALLPPVSGG